MAVSALRKRIAPSVPLTLNMSTDAGGKVSRSFRLCLDFNAIAEIEDRTGVSLLRGEIWGRMKASTLRVMLWAGVLAHHPEFDSYDDKGNRTTDGLEVIGSYLDPGNAVDVSEALWQAYLAAQSDEKRKLLIEARKKVEEEQKAKEAEGVPSPLALTPASSSAPTPAAEIGSSSGPLPDSISGSPIAISAG